MAISNHWSLETRMPITDILRLSAKLAYTEPITRDDIKLLKEIYEDCIKDKTLHNVQDCQDFL